MPMHYSSRREREMEAREGEEQTCCVLNFAYAADIEQQGDGCKAGSQIFFENVYYIHSVMHQ